MAYLASVYGTKSLFGYNVYPNTPDVYEQTGRHGAIWGRDLQWPGDMRQVAQHALDYRYILSFHWHWYFNGESAWASQRVNPVNVGAMVTPGTVEHNLAIAEMSAVADKLQILKDAGVPVLFRPLHEIDGGWFWWTDGANPENTAALYRMLYDYFTNTRGLNNLIWVYNAGTGLTKDVAYRSKYYPGAAYVDISSIDVYNVDYRNAIGNYGFYFDLMAQVAPGKMQALGEADACPDPAKMASGQIPAWLYCMPWWGTPDINHPVDWALYETSHDFFVTLDELPYLGAGSIKPAVGITQPLDDGSARFNNNIPVIQAYATSRNGGIARVDFLANGVAVGSVNSPPYTFTWNNPTPGLYSVQARAVANDGSTMLSNTIHISTGVSDLAFGQPATTSSGSASSAALDASLYSGWQSDKSDTTPDDEWFYVDLGQIYTIDQVMTIWGWKIHPADYAIDVANESPENPASWTNIRSVTNSPYVTWKKTLKDVFDPVQARYVRYHMTKRAGNQTWAGYDLRELDIPRANPVSRDVSVAGASGENHAPIVTQPATATIYDIWERKTTLRTVASDEDRDIPTYTWSVLSGPSDGAKFTPNGTVFSGNTEAAFNKGGNYTLRATATDGLGGTAFSDVSVVVHDVVGSYMSDDRSTQSGNGLGEYEALSMWNLYAMRFVLQKGTVSRAVLRVYRANTDKAPVTIYASSGSTDQWNEATGPNPAKGDLLGSATSSVGGQWVEIDVTRFIAAESQGDGVATIILSSDQSTWNTTMHSRQNAVNPPQLVLTFIP